VKFQDPVFLKKISRQFHDIFVGFTRFKIENARFSVLINVIIIRTKANRHFYKHK